MGRKAGRFSHQEDHLLPRSPDAFFVDTFLNSTRRPPKQIVLDADATDDPLDGH